MKFNLKRIKRMLPKSYVKMYHQNKKNIPSALIAVILILGLASKQPTQAGSTEKGIFGGALTGAAIGGIAGGGKGAGYGALAGAALGGIIGASKDGSSRDPREKRLNTMEKNLRKAENKRNQLYRKRDKIRDQLASTPSESRRAKYERQLADANDAIARQDKQIKQLKIEIDNYSDQVYGGRGSASYRPGGYAAPNRYRY